MGKKCIYCGSSLDDFCVIDFCEKCGKEVWGDKMFKTIVENMENARKNGDLCHSQTFVECPTKSEFDNPNRSFSF